MNFDFLGNIPRFNRLPDKDSGPTCNPANVVSSVSICVEERNRKGHFDFKLLGWSLFSIVPWAINAKDRLPRPTAINKELRRRAQSRGSVQGSSVEEGGNPLPFRPYVSKVPWHTGPRAFLSQLFPRYGHYCGPNWSSGKDNGSLLWDKRPIDWLDYCCYCHDIGYDTHDQAQLLKADLAFLECLEKPYMTAKGDDHAAHVYKTMCITGLRNLLIPYRTHLVKLQAGNFSINFGWLSSVKWRSWGSQKTRK